MANIHDILRHYDDSSPHTESFCWCVGASDYLDLSQFSEEEVLYSEEFDTYCVKYFCGKSEDCMNCKHFKKLCPH